MNWPIVLPQYRVGDHDIVSLFSHMDLHRRREGPEHEVLGKALLHAVRNMGIHVMIVPFDKPPEGFPYGSAYCRRAGDNLVERHIMAFMVPDNKAFFHLLLHEWVHHMLGHCDAWTSSPTFVTEYTTEREVLRIAHEIVSQPLYEQMRQWAKDNVRMHYFRSYVHDSIEIEEWCGYKEADEAEGEAEWSRESMTSLTSNDKSQLPF